MTIPIERARSIENTREFLYALLDPKKTPRVPREVRLWARRCLKHFPANFYIEMTQEKAPEIWGEKDDRFGT